MLLFTPESIWHTRVSLSSCAVGGYDVVRNFFIAFPHNLTVQTIVARRGLSEEIPGKSSGLTHSLNYISHHRK